MPITAVIFDVDGTLVDSASDIQVAINKLLAEEGRRPLALEEVSYSTFKAGVRRGLYPEDWLGPVQNTLSADTCGE